MFKNIKKFAITAALIALPGMAHAGTGTATGSAALGVISQRTIAGATVNLGTYTANQTWGDVGSALGQLDSSSTYSAGTLGLEYLNYGSVTCDSGTPYTFTIKGGGFGGSIQLSHNGKVAQFLPMIKKVGGATAADSPSFLIGAGTMASGPGVAGVGTGAAQALSGHAMLTFGHVATTALPTDKLTTAGTASDTLTYTLNF